MKQPETFEEALDYLRNLGDIKSGYKGMSRRKKGQEGCYPCDLCDVDPYKVADVIQKHIVDEKIRSRSRERKRLKEEITK